MGANRAGPAKRRRLWEIGGQWHCMILGTCLGLAELKALAGRIGLSFSSPHPSDYDIHAAMIRVVSQDSFAAKMAHKLLEKKHALTVKQFARAQTAEAVATLWADAFARGDVAGALWAAMTHPLTDGDLQTRIFGEMHMLSHQVGASARADMRKIHALATEKAAWEIERTQLRERLAQEIARNAGSQRAARADLAALEMECNSLRDQIRKQAAPAQDSSERIARLEQHIQRLEERAATAEAQCQKDAEEIARLLKEMQVMREENQRLECRLCRVLDVGEKEMEENSVCDLPNLCGKRVLYVGGRLAQVPHLRRLVEDAKGAFSHHDGGMEESLGRLGGMLGKADAVMFSVDCVSHTAHDKIKSLCRKWDKPFVPVRHSGLGAFMQALETLSRIGALKAN